MADDKSPPQTELATARDNGATAFGGDVVQDAARDLAGRDLTRIGHQHITNIAEQVVQQPARAGSFPHQLPSGTADFTNREELLADILARCRPTPECADPNAVVAISGGPGVGKSALAVHTAEALCDVYSEIQLYVNLGGADPALALDPNDVLAGFLRALGVMPDEIPTDAAERAALYRSHLAERRAVVVLDNARDEMQVRPLLPGPGPHATLITSRSALTTIEGCRPDVLEEFARSSSIELLEKLVSPARVTAERQHADRIAKLCGDLPLAIRISGALLVKHRQWSLAHLARQLEDEQTRLSHLQIGGLSVRTSFAVAFDQLPAEHQQLFRRLSLLPGQSFGSLPVAAVMEIEPSVIDGMLDDLVDAQLVESHAMGQYALHDLLRLYAGERLAADEEPAAIDEARQRAIEWYLALAYMTSNPDRTDDAEWLRTLLDFATAESDNMLAAARLAYHHEQWDTVVAFGHATLKLFQVRALWDVWEHMARLAVQAASKTDNRAGQGAMLGVLGICLTVQARWSEAIDAHQEGLTIVRAAGERRMEATALSNLGNVYSDQARWAAATSAFEQALTIRAELKDRAGEGEVYNNLSTIYNEQGRWDEAIEICRRALELFREFDDRRSQGHALNNLGVSYRRKEMWDEAIDCYKQDLDICREYGDLHGEAQTQNNIGVVYSGQERWELAIQAFERAQEIFRSFGDRRAEGRTYNNLGIVYRQQGKWDEAIAAYEHDLEITREFGDDHGMAMTYSNLGAVYMAQQRYEDAMDVYRRAATIFEEFGDAAALEQVQGVLSALDDAGSSDSA
jgi:tetratricopeptide (TPR) repeat protein